MRKPSAAGLRAIIAAADATEAEEIRVSHVEEGASSTRQTEESPAPTSGGGIRLCCQQFRDAGRAARRSSLLRAIGRAAVAIGERQIRVAEARMMARLNPFRNWGGAPMLVYRQFRSAERRIVFFDRLARNFRNDLRAPRL